MAKKAQDVYQDALALSESEREELLRLLAAQHDSGFASPEIEQAWTNRTKWCRVYFPASALFSPCRQYKAIEKS